MAFMTSEEQIKRVKENTHSAMIAFVAKHALNTAVMTLKDAGHKYEDMSVIKYEKAQELIRSGLYDGDEYGDFEFGPNDHEKAICAIMSHQI